MDLEQNVKFEDLIKNADGIKTAYNNIKRDTRTENDFLNYSKYDIEKNQNITGTTHQELVQSYNAAINSHLEQINNQRSDFGNNHFGKIIIQPRLIQLQTFYANEYLQNKQTLVEKISQARSSIENLTSQVKEKEQQIKDIESVHERLVENIDKLLDKEKELELTNDSFTFLTKRFEVFSKKQGELIELKNTQEETIEKLNNELNELNQSKDEFNKKISDQIETLKKQNAVFKERLEKLLNESNSKKLSDSDLLKNSETLKGLSNNIATNEEKIMEQQKQIQEYDAKILDTQNQINEAQNSIKDIDKQQEQVKESLDQDSRNIEDFEKKLQEARNFLQELIKKVNNSLQELGYEIEVKSEDNKLVFDETNKATDTQQQVGILQKFKNFIPFRKNADNSKKKTKDNFEEEVKLEDNPNYKRLVEENQKLKDDLQKTNQEKNEAQNQLRDLEQIEKNVKKLNEKVRDINKVYDNHKNWQDQTIQYIKQFLQQQSEFEKLTNSNQDNGNKLEKIIEIINIQSISEIIKSNLEKEIPIKEQTTSYQRLFLETLEKYTELSKQITPILEYCKNNPRYKDRFTNIIEEMKKIYSAFYDKHSISYHNDRYLQINGRSFEEHQQDITVTIININQQLGREIKEQLEKEEKIISGKFGIATSHTKTKQEMQNDYKDSKQELNLAKGEQDKFKQTKELLKINANLKDRKTERAKENWKILAKKLLVLKFALRTLEAIRRKIAPDKSLTDSNVEALQLSNRSTNTEKT